MLPWLRRRIPVVGASATIVGSIIYLSWRGGVADGANILATGLSTLALLGATAALYFQAQQTEIAQWWKTVGTIYHETEWKIGRRQFARIVDEIHAGRSQGPE